MRVNLGRAKTDLSKLFASTRPLAVLSVGVLLSAFGAFGCGDTSESEDDDSPAATAESGADAPKEGVTFGRQSATGEAAIAQAEGIIRKPEIIRLRVVTEPPQTVMVSYTLLCTVNGETGGDSAQFTEETPIDREVELPDGEPTQCNVSANAQLEVGESGRVTMKLRGRER
ncbi:MAG: hypothetical protein ACR2LK_13170 [Solirubrobacteraceae bacterium]